MLLIFGIKFGQNLAKVKLFKFHLYYQKQRYLFIAIEIRVIFQYWD